MADQIERQEAIEQEAIEIVPVFQVQDMPQALAYYCDVLGMRVSFTWGNAPDYAVLVLGDASLHLSAGSQRKPAHACCFLRNVEAFHDAVAGRGARVIEPLATHGYGRREFVVEDADGNRIVFGEFTHNPQSP